MNYRLMLLCTTLSALALPVVAVEPPVRDKVISFKGQCLAGNCDSITLIYSATSKDYVTVKFLRNQKVIIALSGKLYFDTEDNDEKIIIDRMYSTKHTEHTFHPDGTETTVEKSEGWMPHAGGCELFRNGGVLTGIECGQPMISFRVSPAH